MSIVSSANTDDRICLQGFIALMTSIFVRVACEHSPKSVSDGARKTKEKNSKKEKKRSFYFLCVCAVPCAVDSIDAAQIKTNAC